jgi:lipopolysaccharide transport system ATP-binding protein
MNTAISISSLSKAFKRNASSEANITFREVISDIFKKKRRKVTFFALKNISLEIAEGERIGIIGRNGAGKSTLLKILSRITPPTSGEVIINGRSSSLLEVGTGFHAELTGRENIFLNGSILGLRKAEIESRLDEIIQFSGVADFIDVPLKHYSNGMELRLAFSVAAHLESDILFIDEVLAVGDYEFQKKCLGKMEELSRASNKTILFVSHDLNSILNLTERCILLNEGQIEFFGQTEKAVRLYLEKFRSQTSYEASDHFDHPYFQRIKLMTETNDAVFDFGKELSLEVALCLPTTTDALEFSYQICKEETAEPIVYNWFSTAHDLKELSGQQGTFSILIRLPSIRLYKGDYFFRFFLSDPRGRTIYHTIEKTLPFHIQMKDQSNEWGWKDNVAKYIEQYSIQIQRTDISLPH